MTTRLRRRSASLLALAMLATVAVPVATSAQDDASLDRIDMPDGWAPEGITALDGVLYAGSLADGAIWRVDPAIGEGSVLVEGGDGRSVGLDADPASGRLWVAGGNTGLIRANDSASGERLGEWSVEAGFINDVAVTPDAVYLTDSFIPQLIVVETSADGEIAGAAVSIVPITGELEYAEGFNLNGIVATDAGLVVVHTPTGVLYHLDAVTGVTTAIDTGDAALNFGDGLELDGSTLYVVRNRVNEIAVIELASDLTSGELVGTISSDGFDVPTTTALVGDDLWSVNARFGADGGADTEYWMTRTDASPDA